MANALIPVPTDLQFVRTGEATGNIHFTSVDDTLVYQVRMAYAPEFWNEEWVSGDVGPYPVGTPVKVNLTIPALEPPSGLSIGVVDESAESTEPPPEVPEALYFFIVAYDRSLPAGEQAGPIYPSANPGLKYEIVPWVEPEPEPDPVDDPASNQAVVKTERVELWRPFLWFPTPWGKFTFYIGKLLED